MSLKELLDQTNRWLRVHNPFAPLHHPAIGEDGLISRDDDEEGSAVLRTPYGEQSLNRNGAVPGTPYGGQAAPQPAQQAPPPGNEVVVRAIPQIDRSESLEKLQEGFEKLIGQLKGINEHLDRQAGQHEELMGRIEQLPSLLESFPQIVENQKRITEQLIEQLKSSSAKNDRFIDAVEKIPNETAKQTDALVNIDHQLAAAADIDVQMTESLNNFNEALDKLNRSTVSQTDGIVQMSKTFAASDRYLKYIVSRQSKRFMWIFIATISVCMICIFILTGIIIYLHNTSN